MFLTFCKGSLKLHVVIYERKNIQMKEKLMIFIDNFLNLFSDWDFFIKSGKNRVFCIGTGVYNWPLRYTEKIPGCSNKHPDNPLSRVLINEQNFNLMYFTKSHLQVKFKFL